MRQRYSGLHSKHRRVEIASSLAGVPLSNSREMIRATPFTVSAFGH